MPASRSSWRVGPVSTSSRTGSVRARARTRGRGSTGRQDWRWRIDSSPIVQAGLIDELHFALSPVLLGRGEAMFEGLDLPALGYRVMESTATDLATHVVLGREESR